MLTGNGHTYQDPTFHMHVMKGVASGNAIGAAPMHDFDSQIKINYAISTSVLQLTISGDLNLITNSDVRHHGNGEQRWSLKTNE